LKLNVLDIGLNEKFNSFLERVKKNYVFRYGAKIAWFLEDV